MRLTLFCYLHEIAGNKCSTACTTCLAVYINTLSLLSVVQQKPHANGKILLCWCRNHIRCAENQLLDAELCPLLPPSNTLTQDLQQLHSKGSHKSGFV